MKYSLIFFLVLMLAGCHSVPKRYICHKEAPKWAECDSSVEPCMGLPYSEKDMITVCEAIK